ncbi:uncharacterized protein [Setaria viridis]|uniref:uncharacterized protein n=1 Tax=Setaria viridis TaxID=4556 RepID=UPI003B3BA196
MDKIWMYPARRLDAYFRGELNKFIKAVENNALVEKAKMVACPGKTCKNMRVFSETTTVRLHVMVRCFIEDYMIWTSHGEKAPPQDPLDEIMEHVEFERMLDVYDSFDEGVSDDDGGGSDGDDGVDEGGNGGGDANDGYDSSGDNELDDSDFLSQLLHHTKAELLVGSAKGLANFEMVKKSVEENVYERSKGCPKHWTVLHFILELLILKAKHGWSDDSFNDLLRILAWLLPKLNRVSTNTYQAKKLVSSFTMDKRKKGDGKLRYPSDARQWKKFDEWTIQVPYGKMKKDGKKRSRDELTIDGVPFKKLSILYEYLPYWPDLEVHHAIDGMHLKKNMFGNTIGLFLEKSAKTKDTLKSQQDLVAMKIRQDLHPIDKGNGRYELPPASYNLTLDEKKAVCQLL